MNAAPSTGHSPTTADRVRQIGTAAIFLVTLAANGAANALPINGQQTGAISDRFDVLVIPAAYVFGIWGVIYLLLAAFTVHQARPSQATDPTLRRLGWLPAMTGVLNSGWLLLFHYELFLATVPVMIGLLVTLIVINAMTFADRDRLDGAARWVVRLPFSVYLGWITVATIANIAQTLDNLGFDAFGLPREAVAAAVLLTGVAIALTFVWRLADIAYGLVIVWAYAGIVVKEAQTPIVPWVAAFGAIVVAGLVVATVIRQRPPSARWMAGIRPSTPTTRLASSR